MSIILALIVALALLVYWRAALGILLVVVLALILLGMAAVMSEFDHAAGAFAPIATSPVR